VADPLWSARALASLIVQDDYLRPLNPASAHAALLEVEHLVALIADFHGMGCRIDGTGLWHHIIRHIIA